MWNISPEYRFPVAFPWFPIGKLGNSSKARQKTSAWRRLSKRFSMSRLAATTCARFWFGSGGPWAWDIAGIHCQHHMQYILCVCACICVYICMYTVIYICRSLFSILNFYCYNYICIMSIFKYIYTHIMYAMRDLFVLHKHFLRYEYIAPQLSLGASLWRPSLCQHVRHHEIFQISCAWVGIAKGTHGHETSEFVTSSFCTTAHSKQSECATTFGMNSRFQLSKISCSISPSSHRNIILLDCWWRKKIQYCPILSSLFLLHCILCILYQHICFPKLLGFIQTHPLHRATDVLQLLVGREEP